MNDDTEYNLFDEVILDLSLPAMHEVENLIGAGIISIHSVRQRKSYDEYYIPNSTRGVLLSYEGLLLLAAEFTITINRDTLTISK